MNEQEEEPRECEYINKTRCPVYNSGPEPIKRTHCNPELCWVMRKDDTLVSGEQHDE